MAGNADSKCLARCHGKDSFSVGAYSDLRSCGCICCKSGSKSSLQSKKHLSLPSRAWIDLCCSVTGSGALNAQGGFDIGSNVQDDTLTLDNALNIAFFTNSIWQNGAGTGTINGTGYIRNEGTIDLQNDAGIALNLQFDNVNPGKLIKTLGAGDVSFSSIWHTGDIEIQTGTFIINQTSTFYNEGIIDLFSTATLDISAGGMENENELFGSGSIIGDVVNYGSMEVAGDVTETGTLTIIGNLTLRESSFIVFDLGGTTQGSTYDLIDVSGDVKLDGWFLAVWDGIFTSANGAAFDLIQAGGTLTGNFDQFYVPAGIEAHTFNTINGSPNLFP